MLATGRSPAADTGAKDSNGTARTGSHLQAAETQLALTQPDDKASAIAELQEFRPPAAPWQIRYRKQIVAGVAVAATVALPVLGAYLWRSLGPSRLDAVQVLPPDNAILPDATPAPLGAAPVATPAVPQKRSDPIENRVSRRDAGEGKFAPSHSSRSAVTHTKGAARVSGVSADAGPSPQPPSVRIQDQRPASQIECSEAVAALGLCTSTPSTKAAQ